jgi:hypothetical protein
MSVPTDALVAVYAIIARRTRALSLLVLGLALLSGCDTVGQTALETDTPVAEDATAENATLQGLQAFDASPVFEVEGLSSRDSVHVRWGVRRGATLNSVAIYRVYDGEATYVKTAAPPAARFTEGGLADGTYAYAFRTYFDDSSLNGVDWVTLDVDPSENLPNRSVRNLAASVSGNDIILEWDLPGEGTLSEIVVMRYDASGGQNPSRTVSLHPDVTSFADEALTSGTYYYEVKTRFAEPSRNGQSSVNVTLD